LHAFGSMVDATPISLGRTDLINRVAELTQRWLPMMLWRVGVLTSQTARLRVPIVDEQGLRDRLDFAQGAVLFASAKQTQAKQTQAKQTQDSSARVVLVESVIEIVAALRQALDQGVLDLEGAHRRVDGVNRRLIRLIVVGAPASPGVGRAAPLEFASTMTAPFTHMNWWTRLLSRGGAVAGWAHD
jgi:hypothetical protein